jgi:hypothetical protein
MMSAIGALLFIPIAIVVWVFKLLVEFWWVILLLYLWVLYKRNTL